MPLGRSPDVAGVNASGHPPDRMMRRHHPAASIGTAPPDRLISALVERPLDVSCPRPRGARARVDKRTQNRAMTKPFMGRINGDIRDSVPDWSPFEPPKAPAGAPSVVYIVLDDVG